MNNHFPFKKFLFVSWESLSGDLSWQIKKEGHQVKAYIKSETDQDVFDGFIEKVNNWENYLDWADVICFDRETEILTEEGWVRFENLKQGVKVATLKDGKYLVWRKPQKYIRRKYKGKMIACDFSQVNFVVTPLHNLYVANYKKKFDLIPAIKTFGKTRYSVKKNCEWIGKKINKIIIPEVKIRWRCGRPTIENDFTYPKVILSSLNFMAMAGFYLSEGSVIKRWKNINGVRFYQNYGETLKKFKKILEQSNINFKITSKKNGEEIRIYNGALGKFLSDNFGDRAENKRVPYSIKNLDKKHLKFLFDWMMAGDGYLGKNHSFYSTISARLADDFSEIVLKIGYTFKLRKKTEGIMRNPCTGKIYKTKAIYIVGIIARALTPRIKRKHYWKYINYDGEVFCVVVPSHAVLIRRNGIPSWSGNCFDDVGFGKWADELRKRGKLVVGGSEYTDKLEENRNFGQEEMKKVGMSILPHWDFSNYNAAIEFLKENPDRYVFKPNYVVGTGEDLHDLLFLGEEEDGRDLLEIIKSNKIFLKSKIKSFQLQKFASGVEVAVGAFFNGEDFIYPINVNFEHKRLFPSEIGPFTGEMGSLCYWSQPNAIFRETLAKMRLELAKSGYVGYIDINCMANARGIYPLEITSRFGYPTINIQMEGILTPMGEFLYHLANKEKFELRTKRGFQIGVVVALTPYISSHPQDASNYHGLSILFRRPNPNLEGIHLGDVKLVDDQLRVAGVSGYILIVTGSGQTVEEARRQTYNRVKNIRLQNMFYRVDIGTRWYQDSDKLQIWGYL